MKNKVTTYHCTAGTRRDRANLYYIQVNAAHTIRETATRTEILNKHGTIIAIFETV